MLFVRSSSCSRELRFLWVSFSFSLGQWWLEEEAFCCWGGLCVGCAATWEHGAVRCVCVCACARVCVCVCVCVCACAFCPRICTHIMLMFVVSVCTMNGGSMNGSSMNSGSMKRLCQMLSQSLISPHQGVWYFGSDVSMFFLSLYAIRTRYVRKLMIPHATQRACSDHSTNPRLLCASLCTEHCRQQPKHQTRSLLRAKAAATAAQSYACAADQLHLLFSRLCFHSFNKD